MSTIKYHNTVTVPINPLLNASFLIDPTVKSTPNIFKARSANTSVAIRYKTLIINLFHFGYTLLKTEINFTKRTGTREKLINSSSLAHINPRLDVGAMMIANPAASLVP